MNSTLTEIQENFVEGMAEGKNQAVAAREAGCSEATARQAGHNMMKIPKISLAIEIRKEEIAKECNLTMKDRFLMAKRVYHDALEGDKQDLNSATKILEHFAKIFGDYAPDRSENVNQNLNINSVALVEKYSREY